jgi:hypothetical protein
MTTPDQLHSLARASNLLVTQEKHLSLLRLLRTLIYSKRAYFQALAANGRNQGTLTHWSSLCADMGWSLEQGREFLPQALSASDYCVGEQLLSRPGEKLWQLRVDGERLVVSW